jgi:hypothetical protein
MKSMSTILGALAVILASSGAVKADALLAGPLEVDEQFGTVTCSATNAGFEPTGTQAIFLDLQDANGKSLVPGGFNCGFKAPDQSCKQRVRLSSVAGDAPSPYTCDIFSSGPVRGSICGEKSDATYCLQALIDNGSSNGWTCGIECVNPP